MAPKIQGFSLSHVINRLDFTLTSFMRVSKDSPELLKEQYRAFSRQMPMMYFILISSTWAVAVTFCSLTPKWLSIGVPALLTAISITRVFSWWKSRRIDPAPSAALRTLKLTNRLSGFNSIFFTVWALSLFPYGDPYTRSYLAFYMAITAIACIFSLMHLISAAVTVAVVVNGAFIIFFASTGQPSFVSIAINMALVSAGLLAILMINYRDFTAMVEAQTAACRREAEKDRLLKMIEDMPVAVMTVDPESFVIDYANNTSKRLVEKLSHLVPVNPNTLVGTSIDVFHPQPERQRQLLSDPANLPHGTRVKLGSEVIDLKISAVIGADGTSNRLMLTWGLVTNQVEAEERIRQLAHYDALTGLANRINFRDELDTRLGRLGATMALLYVDLDGFKLINDTKGHRAGDHLLRQVAERLRSVSLHSGCTIARLGGDEFAVLLPNATAEQAKALGSSIIASLTTPYLFGSDQSVRIGASVGIALAPDHGNDAESLIAHADIALYAAKAAGKGIVRMFCSVMEKEIQERARLETDLRAALESHKGLFVFYQPIIDVGTGKVTAREALVRWLHKDGRWVAPAEFVPIAEQSGLIEQLSRFVLGRACREANCWKDDARVAVNISSAQLGKGTLAQSVQAALRQSGLASHRLEIEVTETALIENKVESFEDLRQLHKMGVRVALDDFGTGYSSLAHLRTFPFDKIKIDRSFVSGIPNQADSVALVKAVAELARQLGVITVAEGVETEAQMRGIREAGCTEVQGFLYGRPAPSHGDLREIEALRLS